MQLSEDAMAVNAAAINPSNFPYIIASHWQRKNTLSFDVNEIALVNWNAGGISSVSGVVKGNFTRTRTMYKSEWINELIFKYGINKQDGIALKKSDDEFRINSTLGYKKSESSNWFHSVKFNFNTQFSNGYSSSDTSTAISKLFAPAYTFLGIGANYFATKNSIDLYLSPLTFKNTLVLSQTLANSGSYGVKAATYDSDGNLLTKGEKSKTEIGFLASNSFKTVVYENINLQNQLSLYSDYLNNFGNIDVDWQLSVDMIVNKYVKASINLQLLYDDDVKTSEEIDGETISGGATIQLKQSLGVGLVYGF
jgi:hypothetical protein